jgi:hypothetical protein
MWLRRNMLGLNRGWGCFGVFRGAVVVPLRAFGGSGLGWAGEIGERHIKGIHHSVDVILGGDCRVRVGAREGIVCAHGKTLKWVRERGRRDVLCSIQ